MIFEKLFSRLMLLMMDSFISSSWLLTGMSGGIEFSIAA